MNLTPALSVLRNHQDELPFSSANEKSEYIEEVQKLLKREREDCREAVKIAVDASKTLLQVAVAGFGVVVGFVQFVLKDPTDVLALALCGFAALLALMSMVAGFNAISRAYKRGEGREGPDELPWSSKPLKNYLNTQAVTGLLAILVFTSAIVFREPKKDNPRRLYIEVPGSATASGAIESLELSGQWSHLEFIQAGKFNLKLGPVSTGTQGKVRVRFE